MGLNSSPYWTQYLTLRSGKFAGFPLQKAQEPDVGTKPKSPEIPSPKGGKEQKDEPFKPN